MTKKIFNHLYNKRNSFEARKKLYKKLVFVDHAVEELDSDIEDLFRISPNPVNETLTLQTLQVSSSILAEYVGLINKPEEYDYNRMIPYARLCADKYGRLVHLARIAVARITDENFQVHDNCIVEYQQNEGRSISTSDDIVLFPNPSNGKFTLSFADKITAEIVLKDLTGQIIMELSILGESYVELDLSKHLGICLIQIKHLDGLNQVLKAVIVD